MFLQNNLKIENKDKGNQLDLSVICVSNVLTVEVIVFYCCAAFMENADGPNAYFVNGITQSTFVLLLIVRIVISSNVKLTQ